MSMNEIRLIVRHVLTESDAAVLDLNSIRSAIVKLMSSALAEAKDVLAEDIVQMEEQVESSHPDEDDSKINEMYRHAVDKLEANPTRSMRSIITLISSIARRATMFLMPDLPVDDVQVSDHTLINSLVLNALPEAIYDRLLMAHRYGVQPEHSDLELMANTQIMVMLSEITDDLRQHVWDTAMQMPDDSTDDEILAVTRRLDKIRRIKIDVPDDTPGWMRTFGRASPHGLASEIIRNRKRLRQEEDNQ
jgi:hypothetical protein